MSKQRENDINQYFVKKLYNEMNLLGILISEEIKRVKEKANSRRLESDMTLNNIASVIVNSTFTSCKEKLNSIDEFQDYMKFKIPEKQLFEIEEIFLSHYIPFLKNKAEQTYLNQAKELFGETELNIVEKYKFDTSIQNIKIMINNKIEDVKVKNRLKKDEPSVRLSKFSNTISLIALIVAILSLIIHK